MASYTVMFEQWQTLTKGDPILCDGEYTTVQWVAVYPAGTHPLSPIRDDWQALGVHTPRGTRWVGRPEPQYRRGLTTDNYVESHRLAAMAEGYAWGWKDSHLDVPALMSTDFGEAYRLAWLRFQTGEWQAFPAIPVAWVRFREHGTIMWQ